MSVAVTRKKIINKSYYKIVIPKYRTILKNHGDLEGADCSASEWSQLLNGGYQSENFLPTSFLVKIKFTNVHKFSVFTKV